MLERSTTHAQRVSIVERHMAGETIAAIAASLHMSPYTARKWWRAYRQGGWGGLIPQPPGPPVKGALGEFDPMVKYVALRLKLEHPGWGPDVLLLGMSRRPSLNGQPLPKRTALYNYLRPFYPRLRQSGRRLRTRRPVAEVSPARAVHGCWQMDFKGDVPLQAGDRVKPFIVCDELTSAPLSGLIHRASNEKGQGLTSRDIQADLRQIFTQWGLPQRLRMDRDPLWVGSSRLEWPGLLLLWLVGLGVTPIINRAGRPTDNAQVERCNRTWVELVYRGSQCQTPEDLQALTDQAWQDKRENLPSRNPNCHGQAPLTAHPELANPARPYTLAQEETLFNMQRVYDYLSQWEWERTVDSIGCISLADFNRRVHRDYFRQVVKVRFDKESAMFVARSADDAELSRFTLPVISKEYILGQGVYNQ